MQRGGGGGGRQSAALAFLRIAIGIVFLVFAEYKLADTRFIRFGMASTLREFAAHGCYPFMRPFLQHVILPYPVFFGAIVAVTELMIGLGLVFGVLVRWASLGGLTMMVLFGLSADYPASHAAVWRHFGAAGDHLYLALCFIAFLIGRADERWALPIGRGRR